LAAQEAMVVALAVGPGPRSQGVGGKPTPTLIGEFSERWGL